MIDFESDPEALALLQQGIAKLSRPSRRRRLTGRRLLGFFDTSLAITPLSTELNRLERELLLADREAVAMLLSRLFVGAFIEDRRTMRFVDPERPNRPISQYVKVSEPGMGVADANTPSAQHSGRWRGLSPFELALAQFRAAPGERAMLCLGFSLLASGGGRLILDQFEPMSRMKFPSISSESRETALGRAFMDMGEYIRAAEHYRTACILAPSFPTIRLSWLRAAALGYGAAHERTLEADAACEGMNASSSAVRSFCARHRPFVRSAPISCLHQNGGLEILSELAKRVLSGRFL